MCINDLGSIILLESSLRIRYFCRLQDNTKCSGTSASQGKEEVGVLAFICNQMLAVWGNYLKFKLKDGHGHIVEYRIDVLPDLLPARTR